MKRGTVEGVTVARVCQALCHQRDCPMARICYVLTVQHPACFSTPACSCKCRWRIGSIPVVQGIDMFLTRARRFWMNAQRRMVRSCLTKERKGR